MYCALAICISSSSSCNLLAYVKKSNPKTLVRIDSERTISQHTCSSSGSGSGKELIRYSICFALTMRSVTNSFWFAVIHYSETPTPEQLQPSKYTPSKTSGGSNFSGFLCFVTGISGLTCRKLERDVRYAMEFDMIVSSYGVL